MTLLLSVGYLDHGEPEDLIAQLVALLEHLHHGVLTDVLVLHVHHGIVLLRIEGLALRLDAGDAQLLGQVLTAYEGLVKTGNTTDYINNATAGMQASAIIPGFQSLIDGTMTPKAFVESIQAQYEKEVK